MILPTARVCARRPRIAAVTWSSSLCAGISTVITFVSVISPGCLAEKAAPFPAGCGWFVWLRGGFFVLTVLGGSNKTGFPPQNGAPPRHYPDSDRTEPVELRQEHIPRGHRHRRVQRSGHDQMAGL